MRITADSWRQPVARVLGQGYGWVRLLPLVGAIGFLALLHTPELRPSGWDWLLGLGSAALVLAGGRYPLGVTLAQCALVGVAVGLTATEVYIVPLGVGITQILACVALGELALRRPGWPTVWGATAVVAASVCSAYPHYSVAANALQVVGNVGLPLLLGSFLRSQRELAAQAQQRAADTQRRQDWELTAARAAERGAIARELHDVVAHHVAAIVLRVGVARHVAHIGDPRIAEVLDDVHAIGGEALTDLRRLVALLRDPDTVSDPGLLAATDLTAALTTLLDRTRQAGAYVNADIDERVIAELDTVRRHAVLRIVQEALTNVLKHAGPAANAWVAIRSEPDDQVLIEIRDDGGEASRTRSATVPGHGLIVTRERVELLDGHFEAGPRAAGWVLRAALPWSPTTARVSP